MADGFGALIEAGDVGVVGVPTEGGEVGAGVRGEGLDPGGEVIAGVEDGVGPGGGEPFQEGGALEFAGEVEEAGGGGGSEGMVDEEAGGPGTKHALVEDGGGAVGDAFVAGFFEVAEGGVHAFEVVVMDAIERGGSEAEADDDGAEFFPGQAEVTAAAAEEGADDEAVNAAMFEDSGEACRGHAIGSDFEAFEVVTQFGGALGGTGEDQSRPGGAQADGVGITPDEGEGLAGFAGARFAQVGHEAGEFGVGGVAELSGGLLDLGGEGGVDVAFAAKRAGDGHFGDAEGLGDLGQGGIWHDLLR